ncbi:MAG: ribose-phosphate pyrophosphokinase [Tenericutes bacterium]|nr:MAG: ribose-phosphate pyrophosphokinase [Mycoplasmatota bacterium]
MANIVASSKTVLFALPNVEDLGQKVANKLKIKLSKISRTEFADGETLLKANDTVRSKDVFVLSSNARPVNQNIMELLIFIDSLKRASAKSITVVISYYGYARQDRKAAGRQPIAAKLVADLLEKAGATKVIALDLHNPSIQGFFNIPVDDLKGQYVLAPEIKKVGRFTVASPDHGGAVRARILAELISNSVDIAIVDKRRTGPNKSETLGILGNVKNRNVVIIDDIIDTGGTIIKAAKALKKAGAKKVIVAATHGLFTRGFDAFEKSDDISEVLITDSVPSVRDIKSKKLKVISVAEQLAKVISATMKSKSVSAMYVKMKKEI